MVVECTFILVQKSCRTHGTVLTGWSQSSTGSPLRGFLFCTLCTAFFEPKTSAQKLSTVIKLRLLIIAHCLCHASIKLSLQYFYRRAATKQNQTTRDGRPSMVVHYYPPQGTLHRHGTKRCTITASSPLSRRWQYIHTYIL
jgi:hypothetical protein